MTYAKNYAKGTRKSTAQPATTKTDERQVLNNAGGYVFLTKPGERLRRFYINGVDGNTYYVSAPDLVVENVDFVLDAIHDGSMTAHEFETITVDVCTSTSDKNAPAPRKAPVLFMLAVVLVESKKFSKERKEAFRIALDRIIRNRAVVSTLSDVYAVLSNIRAVSKKMTLPRPMRNAFGSAIGAMPLDYQTAKYGERYGFSFRDVLRVTHAGDFDVAQRELVNAYAKGRLNEITELNPVNYGVLEIKRTFAEGKLSQKDMTRFILDRMSRGITWEMLPTEIRSDKNAEMRKHIYRALLGLDTLGMTGFRPMPMNALLRSLPLLTQYGVLDDDDAVDFVTEVFGNAEVLRRARVHPMRILQARIQYGKRDDAKPFVLDALEDAMSLALDVAPKSNKRIFHAIDASGSMSSPWYGNTFAGLTPFQNAMAFAWMLRSTHPKATFKQFTYHGDISDIKIRRNTSFNEVMSVKAHGSGTDLSLPIEDALRTGEFYDAIVIHTDNETWSGKHAYQTMDDYRRRVNPNCKLIVVAYEPNASTIVSPDDKQGMNVVGFDTSVPSIIDDFVG